MTITKINIEEKLNLFSEHWSPRIIAELNDSHVKLAKFKGEFVWHKHDNEDEMFFVIKGSFLMRFREEDMDDIRLEEGDMLVVPRGVEHMPVAQEEVHVMVIEPISTVNTGDVESDRTVLDLKQI